jgi:hypothetical protein
VKRYDATGADESPHCAEELAGVHLMNEDVSTYRSIESRWCIVGVDPIHQELDIAAAGFNPT